MKTYLTCAHNTASIDRVYLPLKWRIDALWVVTNSKKKITWLSEWCERVWVYSTDANAFSLASMLLLPDVFFERVLKFISVSCGRHDLDNKPWQPWTGPVIVGLALIDIYVYTRVRTTVDTAFTHSIKTNNNSHVVLTVFQRIEVSTIIQLS